MVVKDILPLKLQAYERLTLFIDRINPSNLFIRLHQPGMSAREIHSVIISEIRAEYQHNISQQLYISTTAWNIISRVKEDTLSLVKHAITNLHPEASAVELSKGVFAKLESLEENPYDLALLVLRNDIQEL